MDGEEPSIVVTGILAFFGGITIFAFLYQYMINRVPVKKDVNNTDDNNTDDNNNVDNNTDDNNTDDNNTDDNNTYIGKTPLPIVRPSPAYLSDADRSPSVYLQMEDIKEHFHNIDPGNLGDDDCLYSDIESEIKSKY